MFVLVVRSRNGRFREPERLGSTPRDGRSRCDRRHGARAHRASALDRADRSCARPRFDEAARRESKPRLRHVPTLDGRSNPGKDFLCGTSAKDTIHAGPNDVVRAGGGSDLIYTQNGGPNDVDGGTGTNKASVDRWDTYKGIQSRTLGAFVPKARVDRTPAGFDYSLPNVVCGLDSQDHQMIRLDLPTGKRIMMAAYDANRGVVDWQYVAWTTLIYKWEDGHTWNVV